MFIAIVIDSYAYLLTLVNGATPAMRIYLLWSMVPCHCSFCYGAAIPRRRTRTGELLRWLP
jgi:hypothetical protein